MRINSYGEADDHHVEEGAGGGDGVSFRWRWMGWRKEEKPWSWSETSSADWGGSSQMSRVACSGPLLPYSDADGVAADKNPMLVVLSISWFMPTTAPSNIPVCSECFGPLFNEVRASAMQYPPLPTGP